MRQPGNSPFSDRRKAEARSWEILSKIGYASHAAGDREPNTHIALSDSEVSGVSA